MEELEELMDGDLHDPELGILTPLRERLRRTRGAEFHEKPAFKPGRGPSLLLLDPDFAFASALARLAETRNLALALCWTLEDLQRLPFTHFDAAIVERSLWEKLNVPAHQQLAASFRGISTLVVDPGLVAGELPGVTVVAKAEGPGAVLDTALRIALAYEHPVLPH